jgi:hypothetical protein
MSSDQNDGQGKAVALELRVEGDSRRETNQLVGDLQAFLQEKTEQIQFERAREDATAMDAGTLLVALVPVAVELAKVAGPALKELAKGLADWMRKRNVSVVVNGVSLGGPPDQVEAVLRQLVASHS